MVETSITIVRVADIEYELLRKLSDETNAYA